MKRNALKSLALCVILGAGYAQAENRVGVTIYKYDDYFMSLMRKDIQNEAKNYPQLELLMNDAQNSQVIQLRQIENLLSHKTKVLAVNIVSSNETRTVAEKAKEYNVPIVFFNRTPTPEVLERYDNIYFVSGDPAEAGKIQGELIAKAWRANPALDLNKDGKLQYVLLKGEPGDVSVARSQAVVEELNRQGIATEEVYSDNAMWRTAIGRNKMNEWLVGKRASEIEVVISNNDEMAIGALDALRAHEKKLPVFGVDALPQALALIKSGEMSGSVLNDSLGQSKAVVKLAANLAEGKPAKQGTEWEGDPSKIIYVPHIGVDKDNLDQFWK